MKEPLRYRICIWMVYAQALLLPVVISMISAEANTRVWRYNLLAWTMLAGWLLGLLAWPLSRGLDKPNILKWTLRIDFVATILLFIPFYITFESLKVNYIAEKGDYVLYHRGGFMARPILRTGICDGLFIKEIYSVDAIAFRVPDEDWMIDVTTGYSDLNTTYDNYHFINSFPIDSALYHQNLEIINRRIDSLYLAFYPNADNMTFVMPQDFSRIVYTDSTSVYYYRAEDNPWMPGELHIQYQHPFDKNTSDSATIYLPEPHSPLRLPKDSVPRMSPTRLHRFATDLQSKYE